MGRARTLWIITLTALAVATVVSLARGDVYGALTNGLGIPAGLFLWWVLRRLEAPLHAHASLAGLLVLALILGTVTSFYVRFPWWDLFLHAYSGMALAAIFFWALQDSDARIPATLLFLLAVLAANGVGAFWEIYEYVVGVTPKDMIITDTITDLVANAVGSLLAAFVLLRR